MQIKCKNCGEVVAEGEVVSRKNGCGRTIKAFDLFGKPNGAIIKNNSNDVKDWTGICSKCQAEKDRRKK